MSTFYSEPCRLFIQQNSSHIQSTVVCPTGDPISDLTSTAGFPTSQSLVTSSNHKGSISFDELTCQEKLKALAEGSGSQVCKSQDEQFNLVFSLATSINGVLSFPSGFLYDRLGTRISRIISIVSFTAGQLCLIFASSSSPHLLYPGFLGLVYGGYQILLTNLQISSLLPGLKSTVMSLYSGSYDTSSAVFLAFKAAYEGGFSINYMFICHSVLYLLIFTGSTFFLLPRMHIPSPLPPSYRLRSDVCRRLHAKTKSANNTHAKMEYRIDEMGSAVLLESLAVTDVDGNNTHANHESVYPEKLDAAEEGEGLQSVQEKDGVIPSDGRPTDSKTFRQVALSPLFITDLVWMCVQRLRSWIFVGMFNPWITRLACGDKSLVSHYTSAYAAMQFFGIFTAPLSGRLMDRKIRGGDRYGNPRYERLHASIASFILNSTVSVLLTVGTLIPVLQLQYITCLLHTLHRSFLYGPNSAFVANAFPNEHFGKLFGITLTVSAVFSALQYPLFLIMQGPLNGDPFFINVFLLVLMLVSFVHPIYIWCYLKKKLTKA
ncbi:solute carrier family 43 member 3-like isoform X2 [Pomacea canaliculata]|nr:solute carrier family 43 member 3-like isoform X2 [Pomacea canaliculata]